MSTLELQAHDSPPPAAQHTRSAPASAVLALDTGHPLHLAQPIALAEALAGRAVG